MATWVTVSANDVRVSDGEKSAVTNLAPGITLQSIVDKAANRARGYVGVRTQLADAPLVPPEVVDDVLALAAVDFLSLVPGSGFVDQPRSDAAKTALAHLRDVASGKALVTPADVPSATQPSSPSPAITVPAQSFQPSNQDGI
jgi:hypothetical protein